MEARIAERMAINLIHRLGSGPMHFRFFLQPAMAAYCALRDGIHDARQGKPAYLWDIVTHEAHAGKQLISGFKAVLSALILAIVMDAIYQLIVLHWFYPGEALLVALFLAFIPYLLVRGPANRITKWRMKHTSKKQEPKITD